MSKFLNTESKSKLESNYESFKHCIDDCLWTLGKSKN